MPGVVDYSWGRPQPFPTSIAAAGHIGAMRYLCAELSAKRLQRGEADALRAAGLTFGLVYEDEAAAPLQGFARGAANAQRAEQQAGAAGFPANRPIYHAVDFDVRPNQYPALDAYRRGVESVSGRPFGWYGHYALCEHYGPTGAYLWQCAAWSGNGVGSGGSIQGRRVSRYARLFQRVGYVLGNTCDLNDVLSTDWGQENFHTPPPTPVPPTGRPAMFTVQFPNNPGQYVAQYRPVPNSHGVQDSELIFVHLKDGKVASLANLPNFMLASGDDELDRLWTEANDNGRTFPKL